MHDRSRTLFVLAVAVVVFTAGLGGYGLWDPDEGRHSAIARELFSATTWQGWIVPSQNFAPYYDKPILYYWLTSLAYAVVGLNEWGARLVSALAALTTLGAVFAWTTTLWDARLGRRAVLVLASSAGFIALGRYGNLDMLLTCWITLGVIAAERAMARPAHSILAVAAGAAAGLGMLTKGLVAPLLITGVGFVQAWLVDRRTPPLRTLALAALAFTVVATPWYVAAGAVDPAYLREFFVVHHLRRFTVARAAFHSSPWWYYAPALVVMFFPWSLLLPAAVGATASRRDPGLLRCWAWAATVIVFFSLSRGKLATYILPALPPLAIVTAHAIDGLATTPRRGLQRLAAGGVVGFALALALAAAVPLVLRVDRDPWPGIVSRALPYLVLIPIAAIAILTTLRRRGIAWAWVAVSASVMTIVVTFYTCIAPGLNTAVGARTIAEVIATRPSAPIVSYGVKPASLMFYVGRPILPVNGADRIREIRAQQPFTWIVTTRRHVEELGRTLPIYPWVPAGRQVLYATAPREPSGQRSSAAVVHEN